MKDVILVSRPGRNRTTPFPKCSIMTIKESPLTLLILRSHEGQAKAQCCQVSASGHPCCTRQPFMTVTNSNNHGAYYIL